MLRTPVEVMLFAIAGCLNEEQRHRIELLQGAGVTSVRLPPRANPPGLEQQAY